LAVGTFLNEVYKTAKLVTEEERKENEERLHRASVGEPDVIRGRTPRDGTPS
jgi:hypothetical protein